MQPVQSVLKYWQGTLSLEWVAGIEDSPACAQHESSVAHGEQDTHRKTRECSRERAAYFLRRLSHVGKWDKYQEVELHYSPCFAPRGWMLQPLSPELMADIVSI